jgi:restriction system protein
MGTAWRHTATRDAWDFSYLDLISNSSVYPPNAGGACIKCPYCGNYPEEYSGSDYWELTFADFKKAHTAQSRRMKRAGVAPDPEHLELSGQVTDHYSTLYLCPMCGWWIAVDEAVLPAVRWQYWYIMLTSVAMLQELDLGDIKTPVREVRSYLMRKFSARKLLHPRLFEETVASVFRDHGYQSTVTAYTRDGGIDVVLTGPNREHIGVQVKRYRRAIQVEQIRAFLGALTIGKYTRGIFVTTSNYQRGSRKLAAYCCEHHTPIELVDAPSFLEILGIAQLKNGVHPEECNIGKDQPLRFNMHTHLNLNSL